MPNMWVIFLSLFLFFPAGSYSETSGVKVQEKEIVEEQRIPFSMRDKGELPNVGRIFFAVIVSIALVFFIAFFLKKFFYNPSLLKDEKGFINIIKSKKITTKLTAHVIGVDNKSYLIVEKGDSVSLLHHGTIEEKDS